jgi:hypothetical protein
MPYITFLFGVGLIALGVYGWLDSGRVSITALIPSVFGLAYLTLGEGMRSLPKRRRLFLFIGAIISLVGMAGTFKSALQLPAIVRGEELPPRANGSRITPETVYIQFTMLSACVLYLILSLLTYFRSPAAASGKSLPNTSDH